MHIASIRDAGVALLKGSPRVLRWQIIAPAIKIPIPNAAYWTTEEYQIPAISNIARPSFVPPIRYTDQFGNPYT